MPEIRFVIEGARGTGKSLVAAWLGSNGYRAVERGMLARAAAGCDWELARERPAPGEHLLVLQAPVSVCIERLRRAPLPAGGPDIDHDLLQMEVDGYIYMAKRMEFLHPGCCSVIDTHVALPHLRSLLLIRACTVRLRSAVHRSKGRS
jgi:hypothetical protein